jgi:hypothetical protein
MIEQAMLGAIQQATEAERTNLLTMATTLPLPALTRTLQAHSPRYATFFTDSRVARVMEAFQATNARPVQQNGHDTTITRATERHQGDSDRRAPGRHDRSPQDDNDRRAPGRHDRSPQGDTTAEDATPEQATQATETTAKGDLTTAILAYQAEIAAALGVTVRTIQRKLTALKAEVSAV